MLLLALKLALVATTILGASFAARRWGHGVSGLMAGLPLIVGPITAILLLDQPVERVRAIALATLQSQPAMLLHVLVFAHAARRWRWPACLLLANAVYLVLAALLTALALAPLAATALTAAAWLAAGRAMPKGLGGPHAPVSVPASEIWWRLAIALAVAASVIQGAATLPAAWGGILLAAPITGNVLPAFTLPRHGPQATARLLGGFVRGQLGFAAFIAVIVALLPWLHPAAAFASAVGAAIAAPWLLSQRTRARS